MSRVYLAQSAHLNSAKELEVVEDSEPERDALRSSPQEVTVCSQEARDVDRDPGSLASIIEFTDDAVDLPSSISSRTTKSALSEVGDSSANFLHKLNKAQGTYFFC